MIYFAENEKSNEIKIGYAAVVSNRMKQHEGYGFKLICAMPGNEESEQKLHKNFSSYICRGNEYYHRNDTILEYCIKLIDKGFAHPDGEFAKQLPELPFSAWGPEFLKEGAIEVNGQLSILPMLPVGNRLKIVSAQAQNHSFTDEWYTPEEIIKFAISVLGSIDTDPATSFAVNLKYIKARTFYTKHTNGLDLSRPWYGNVWLNPPYGKGEGSAGDFVARLCHEIKNKNVIQAITCLNVASMSSKWFYTTIPHVVSAHCILHGRLNFVPPDGKIATSPNKGTVISYFGDNTKLFSEKFAPIGQILIPQGTV